MIEMSTLIPELCSILTKNESSIPKPQLINLGEYPEYLLGITPNPDLFVYPTRINEKERVILPSDYQKNNAIRLSITEDFNKLTVISGSDNMREEFESESFLFKLPNTPATTNKTSPKSYENRQSEDPLERESEEIGFFIL
jgi:hypothetical protein